MVGLVTGCFANEAQWISSTAERPWTAQPGPTLGWTWDDKPFDLVVRLDESEQTIDGWGGCFNELGWLALQSASPEDRNEVLRRLFAPGAGLNFTICRMPIGASDYATNWYSLDDTPGDFDLEHFNLDRDRTLLLPYIKAAMKFQPDLAIWGSPWSPPAWLKVNGAYNSAGTNRMIQEERHLSTYARYLVKYVKAYRAEGVNVFAVAVQNEPFASQGFPSCVWSPEELRDLIGKHVGPAFEREKVNAQLWLGTFNNNRFSAFDTSLSDPAAAKYISAVGLQWAGKNALPEIKAYYPRLKLVQTESECGDGSFDWKSAEYTFGLMKFYFSHGVNLYTYWNMVLDDTGTSAWGWKQNALITVSKITGKVTYTPEFWLFDHVAHFVPRGSVRLNCWGNFDNALAFQTPDKKLILVAVNTQDDPMTMAAKLGSRLLEVKLPARSFNTFQIPNADEMETHR